MRKTSFAKMLNFGSFEGFVLKEFRNGIKLAMADIVYGKYFLYLQSPQNALFPCVIYNSLLPLRLHNQRRKPVIHFMKCDFLGEITDSTKAKIMRENAFDYAVGSSVKFSAKLFYGIKLPFCAKCVESYEAIFGDFDENRIWDKMLKNELFSAIELESLKAESMAESFDISKADNHFVMVYKRG